MKCKRLHYLLECFLLYSYVAFFAFSSIFCEGCHCKGSSICVLTVMIEDNVPVMSKDALLGVLFLFIKEKILSSPALER